MKKKPIEPHYSFDFPGIADRFKGSTFTVTDHTNPLDERKLYANVFVDEKDFPQLRGLRVEERIADAIDLAVAVHTADRWSQRHPDYPSRIEVKLAVRNFDLYSSSHISKSLERLMFWFTGDTWLFEFVPFSQQKRTAEIQLNMWQASNLGVETEVALFSGGADSLTGLLNRIRNDSASRFLLFGAGGNSPVRGLQQRIFNLLRYRIQADIHLAQLHIFQRTRKFGLRPDKNLRARGFIFMLLGGAYAQLEGQNRLMLYENGIGAINLPFRASEVGIDHARSVHPLSLHYMSEFLSLIFARPFQVQNPFLWWTKGEMFHVLKEMKLSDIAYRTISCDRVHRKSVAQCGRCSSCLLRRAAFLAVGIPDETRYLVDASAGDELNRLLRTSHLPHMLYQARYLENIVANEDWAALAHQHPSRIADAAEILGHMEGDMETWANSLISLYKHYVMEWQQDNVLVPFSKEIERIKQALKETKQVVSPASEGN